MSEIKVPDRPICQYCGRTPRTTLKNHYNHCKEKPAGKPGRPKGSGNGQKVKGSGRKAGVRNKSTMTAKQCIQDVFDKLGGVSAMTDWAIRNQTEFYTKIYPKILPLDTNIKHSAEQLPALNITLTHDPDNPKAKKAEPTKPTDEEK